MFSSNRPLSAESIARTRFDFPSLRPGQQEAIDSVVSGRHTLVVQPTGSGKSAIYQISGLMLDGVTVVVSPLIALQKDQVDSIDGVEGNIAVVINSTQKAAESKQVAQRIDQGEVQYILLAPEQFRKQETMERLRQAGVALFVVDEAHCISEWGHDFRPDYQELGAVIEQLGDPTVLALTATASESVREEIVRRLNMREANVLVRGFDRPNLFLRVDAFATQADKLDALIHRVLWAEKPGIVYVATRKAAEQIMGRLAEEGVNAVFYHGGMKAGDRSQVQERFMSGHAEVIVATNAFGMGVNKSNVRFVYHHDLPESLDAYYQEIGRAGRDGEPAEVVLFYREADVGAAKFRAGGGSLDPQKVEQVVEAIAAADGSAALEQIEEQVDVSPRKLVTLLHRLEDVGAVARTADGQVALTEDEDSHQIAAETVAEQERHREHKRESLEKMTAYATVPSCRRQWLLEYFGEAFQPPCEACDNCQHAGSTMGAGVRREVV